MLFMFCMCVCSVCVCVFMKKETTVKTIQFGLSFKAANLLSLQSYEPQWLWNIVSVDTGSLSSSLLLEKVKI